MSSRIAYVKGSKKYMGLFSLRPPVVMVTNKMAAILEQIKQNLWAHSSRFYNN